MPADKKKSVVKVKVRKVGITPPTISQLNNMPKYSVLPVSEKLQVRRVPGGFLYEYFAGVGVVSAATFMSNNELSRD